MSSSFKKEIGQVNKAIAECIALIAKARERKGLESNDETRLKRLANVLKNHIINRERIWVGRFGRTAAAKNDPERSV